MALEFSEELIEKKDLNQHCSPSRLINYKLYAKENSLTNIFRVLNMIFFSIKLIEWEGIPNITWTEF